MSFRQIYRENEGYLCYAQIEFVRLNMGWEVLLSSVVHMNTSILI